MPLRHESLLGSVFAKRLTDIVKNRECAEEEKFV